MPRDDDYPRLAYYPQIDLIRYDGHKIKGHALRALVAAGIGDLLEVGCDDFGSKTVLHITHGSPAAAPTLHATVHRRPRHPHPFFSHSEHHFMSNVSLKWENPTTRQDGSALPDGAISHIVLTRLKAGDEAPTSQSFSGAPASFLDQNVADGVYRYQVFAVTGAGQGEGSNVVEVTVGTGSGTPPETVLPGAPTNLIATVEA